MSARIVVALFLLASAFGQSTAEALPAEARHYPKLNSRRPSTLPTAGALGSKNGKWQYRAKPGGVMGNHIHLEELNPKTGRGYPESPLEVAEGGRP